MPCSGGNLAPFRRVGCRPPMAAVVTTCGKHGTCQSPLCSAVGRKPSHEEGRAGRRGLSSLHRSNVPLRKSEPGNARLPWTFGVTLRYQRLCLVKSLRGVLATSKLWWQDPIRTKDTTGSKGLGHSSAQQAPAAQGAPRGEHWLTATTGWRCHVGVDYDTWRVGAILPSRRVQTGHAGRDGMDSPPQA